MSYNHLTLSERCCLAEFHEQGLSLRAIARRLKRSPSTISRELRRNKNQKTGLYNPRGANNKSAHRKSMPRRLIGIKSADCEKLKYVVTALTDWCWTPEQAAGRWNRSHSDDRLSVSTIYRHIKRNLLPGVSAKANLRRRGKRKVSKAVHCNTIHPDRIIPEWPEEIRLRQRIGDWEGDRICGGKGKGAAVTLVDRKSGYICGWVVQSGQANETRQAILSALKGMPVQSLSLDNGSEFAEFHELESQLNTLVFFAEMHKPWQRGCNENANGLLRFFYPKGCDFRNVSQEEFQCVLDLINHRPRKRLNWLTPFEVFTAVALA